MKKILFCDVDGTLTYMNKELHPDNKKAMALWQQKGNLIAICSGRNPINVQPFLHEHHFPYDYLILCNGGYIEDKQGNVLYQKVLDVSVGNEIIQQLLINQEMKIEASHQGGIIFSYQDENYTIENNERAVCHKTLQEFMQEARFYYMLSFNTIDLDETKAREAMNKLSPLYKDEASFHLNEVYVDIVPPHLSKGTGIKELIKKIDVDKTIAIGDSYNDISMFDMVDLPVTFTYAPDEVKLRVNQIVDYVFELIHNELKCDC